MFGRRPSEVSRHRRARRMAANRTPSGPWNVAIGADSMPPVSSEGFRPVTISDRKSTRLNSSHLGISYAVFCLKKKSHHHSTDHGDARGRVDFDLAGYPARN